MKQELDNHNLLIQYLLGKLNGEEHEEKRELIEQYFEDDELFEELLSVENDLLDKYVRGELASNDRDAFLRYLKSLPDGHDKVAFAATLAQVIEEKKNQTNVAPITILTAERESPSISLWQSLLILIQQPNSALQYTLIIGAGLMAIGISSLAIYNYHLQKSNDQFQAQLAQKKTETVEQKQKATDLQQQVNAKDNQIEQLQNELERLKQRDKTQSPEKIRHESLTIYTASLAFPRTVIRSPDKPVKLFLSKKTEIVLITIPIKDTMSYLGYEAVLRPTERDLAPILEQKMKQDRPLRLGEVITLKLAANQLVKTSYKLTLTLEDNNNEKISNDFYFIVVER